MADLIFATKGQAEALAAQEQIAKKGRELRQEFESGAKSVGAWDANTAKLQRTSEAALRSIQTEQEKVAEKISLINERQAKGIGTTEENEAAIAKLREQWVELDDATVKQKEAVQAVADEHTRLKTSAETALRSVATEEERVNDELEAIEQQIHDVEGAMEEGLIPPAAAEAGVKRLRERMDELKNSVNETEAGTGRFGLAFAKAFDPVNLAKLAAGFVGVRAVVGFIKSDIEDTQRAIDKMYARAIKGFEEAEKAGDKERADKLRPIAERLKGLEAGAQGTAEAAAPRSPWLSPQEQALIDEALANVGQGGGTRTINSLLQRLGHFDTGFGITRKEKAEEVRGVLESLLGQIRSYGGDIKGSVTYDTFAQQREQVESLKQILAVLQDIKNKEGGIPVSAD